MSTKLHVGNISSLVPGDGLKGMFGRSGPVGTVEIPRDPGTGARKAPGIVVTSVDEDASAAIVRLNVTRYTGRTVANSQSRAKSSRPSILP